MLSRLFGRRPPAEEPTPPSEDAKPGPWDRIKAFFVAVWNWTILLGAVVGLIICARLSYVFVKSAWISTDTGSTLWFAGLAVLGLAGTVFLGWQSWRGIRYIRHRRRGG